MRPWQHARSSAGKNQDWLNDLALHEFVDSSKIACPDLRHRMVLHNCDLGADLTARAFPDRPDARDVMLRHVREDLGCIPTLADWLSHCDLSKWPRPLERRESAGFEEILEKISDSYGLKDASPLLEVLDILKLPGQYAGDESLPVLFNGFGPYIVKSILGGPRTIMGRYVENLVFDPAHAAEAIIYHYYGTIPHLHNIVSAVHRFPSKLDEASCHKTGTQN